MKRRTRLQRRKKVRVCISVDEELYEEFLFYTSNTSSYLQECMLRCVNKIRKEHNLDPLRIIDIVYNDKKKNKTSEEDISMEELDKLFESL